MAELTEELRVLVTAEVDRAIKQLGSLDKKTKSTENSKPVQETGRTGRHIVRSVFPGPAAGLPVASTDKT